MLGDSSPELDHFFTFAATVPRGLLLQTNPPTAGERPGTVGCGGAPPGNGCRSPECMIKTLKEEQSFMDPVQDHLY